MVEKIKELLKSEGIDLSVFLPLDKCVITKKYLLERADIDSGFAVIFAIPYYTKACDEDRNISAYAVGRDYHLFVKELSARLIPKLKVLYPNISFALFADHSPINERDAALKGGLGMLGKNGLIITEKYSSYIFLAELIVGAELESGICRQQSPRYCEGCGLCVSACPWKNGECGECLSAITQKKGELSSSEQDILKKYSLWGCDICTEVCPHTKKAKKAGTIYSPIEFFSVKTTPKLTYEMIENMDEEEFAKRAFSWRGRPTLLRNLETIRSDEEK